MKRYLPWETDPENYDALLAEKVQVVSAAMSGIGLPAPLVHPSPPLAYRARAEFRIWHDGEDLYYAMFDPQSPREPVRIDSFPPALEPVQRLMTRLIERLRPLDTLRRKLFQVEFMSSRDGDALVTLAYHRRLDDAWEAAARNLAGELGVAIVGRSRRQKVVIGRDFIEESFRVGGRDYRYRQYEQSFAQPNAPVNEAMLNWAFARSADLGGDLLELYCGNGNFTLPLSRHFARVLATELAKSGTRAALENLAANDIDNVDVIRLSAEEVSAALAGAREFRRLAALPQPLADYALNTVFVDPPRAGLDPATLACVQRFERILYISCNPDTLRSNLCALADTHVAQAFALFDQFPYTTHMESGVLLARKPR